MNTNIIIKIKKIYSKELFAPKFLGIFINPLYFIRRGIYKGIFSNKNYLRGRLLDFGCGKKPYKNIINVQEYIGLDIEKSGHDHKQEEVDIYYNGKNIPFPDNYFDSILAAEVFEHLFNLEEILKELFRVIKIDGYILVTLPFVYEEHEAPYDFARYTSFGIRHLLESTGFKVVKIEKSTNYVETVCQTWNSYVYQSILPKNMLAKTIMLPFFIAPITILGIIFSKILPENRNFYHNTIILARR
jgi:SAM-dependent methyltransferase